MVLPAVAQGHWDRREEIAQVRAEIHCQHSLQSFQHPPSVWARIFSEQCVAHRDKYFIFLQKLKINTCQ